MLRPGLQFEGVHNHPLMARFWPLLRVVVEEPIRLPPKPPNGAPGTDSLLRRHLNATKTRGSNRPSNATAPVRRDIDSRLPYRRTLERTTMDPVLGSVVVACISALGSAAIWAVQQTKARADNEAQRREALYRGLLSALVDMSAMGNAAPLLVESQEMWLYASDRVILAVNDYIRFYLGRINAGEVQGAPVSEADRIRIQYFDAQIRLAIRQDIVQRTQIDAKWVESEWTSFGAPPERIHAYRVRKASGSRGSSGSTDRTTAKEPKS